MQKAICGLSAGAICWFEASWSDYPLLEGTGRFTVGGQVFLLSEGETLVMPKDIPHAVFGEEKFKMQLIVSY